MARYQVSFFNNLLSSAGREFKCLQRTIEVQKAMTPADAFEKASRKFKKLENVRHWKDHAQFAEVAMKLPRSKVP
jgi:hypothetical protein